MEWIIGMLRVKREEFRKKITEIPPQMGISTEALTRSIADINNAISILSEGQKQLETAAPELYQDVSGCFSADDMQKAYQAGAIETLTDGTGKNTPSFNDLKEIEIDAKKWFYRYNK